MSSLSETTEYPTEPAPIDNRHPTVLYEDCADSQLDQSGSDINLPTLKLWSDSSSSNLEAENADSLDFDMIDYGVVEDHVFISDKFEGESICHFDIGKRLGSGGMARVYLGFDNSLKRQVAVKIIQNRQFVNSEYQANFLVDEAISQAQLNHENIVSIFFVGKEDGIPYLVMEYVDGESLDQTLSSGSIEFRRTLRYAKQIVLALQHAKKYGVIHGDIKPANLLLTKEDKIKLTDFGLARTLSESESNAENEKGRIIGTPAYMAPEIFNRESTTEQTDLYALGVTLFELTFGHHPYRLHGETAQEAKLSLDTAELEFPAFWPEDLPSKWRKILLKLLEKDNSLRYQTFDQLSDDLEQIPDEVRPAPLRSRFLGLFVDYAIILFLCLPYLAATTSNAIHTFMGQLHSNLYLFGPVAYILLSVRLNGSVGRFITGTRVVCGQWILVTKCNLMKLELARTAPALILAILAGTFVSGNLFGATMLLTALGLLGLLATKRFRSPEKREAFLSTWNHTQVMQAV